MTALATRHIGNDVHSQAQALFALLGEARSTLYLNGGEDRFWLATSMDEPLDDRALVALERITKAVKQGPPEFREALKDECRRRRLVA